MTTKQAAVLALIDTMIRENEIESFVFRRDFKTGEPCLYVTPFIGRPGDKSAVRFNGRDMAEVFDRFMKHDFKRVDVPLENRWRERNGFTPNPNRLSVSDAFENYIANLKLGIS